MFNTLRQLLGIGSGADANGRNNSSGETKSGGLSRGKNGSPRSGAAAKSRLSFVLVQDRTGLSADEMGKFKKEMIQVIERYFKIDEKGFDINYKRDGDMTTLLINSPVLVRRLGEEGDSKKHRQANRKGDEPAAQPA